MRGERASPKMFNNSFHPRASIRVRAPLDSDAFYRLRILRQSFGEAHTKARLVCVYLWPRFAL